MVSINSTPHDRYAIIPLTRTGLVGFITVKSPPLVLRKTNKGEPATLPLLSASFYFK